MTALNTAISQHEAALEKLRGSRVVFIFDECHRSQFGATHKRITEFFTNAQMFGFTGTPIFADNAVGNVLGKRTTKDLFEECLHRYLITDAIRDENVLRFSIEYWGKLKRRDGSLIDEDVPSINVKEFFENPERIEGVVDWIIANHVRKTHGKTFTAMLCVGSVDALITFYETLRKKKEAGVHDLRVATIFSYTANEEDPDANGLIGDPDFVIGPESPVNTHSRDKLESFIKDYNEMFGTQFSAKDNQDFYNYYRNIAKRIKERERKDFSDTDRVDILLVVNMYLTGFDAKKVNTLYVDKSLKYHGLIQAFSRTNRTLGQLKSQGNIVCFRNLKKRTDEAIRLFSNKNAQEEILLGPYEDYLDKFNQAVDVLRNIAPTVGSVDELESEEDQLVFVRAFRQIIRLRNVLIGFSQFNTEDLIIDPQTFEDYKSKYLDIYDRTKKPKEGEGASIIDEVDFELELIQRDEINVAYILALLAEIEEADAHSDRANGTDKRQKREAVFDLLGSEVKLRSKRELVERFINDYMPNRSKDTSVQEAFSQYWTKERELELQKICMEEGIDPGALQAMIDTYHFSGKAPLRETVIDALAEKPKIRERRTVVGRVLQRLVEFVNTFDDAIGNL